MWAEVRSACLGMAIRGGVRGLQVGVNVQSLAAGDFPFAPLEASRVANAFAGSPLERAFQCAVKDMTRSTSRPDDDGPVPVLSGLVRTAWSASARVDWVLPAQNSPSSNTGVSRPTLQENALQTVQTRIMQKACLSASTHWPTPGRARPLSETQPACCLSCRVSPSRDRRPVITQRSPGDKEQGSAGPLMRLPCLRVQHVLHGGSRIAQRGSSRLEVTGRDLPRDPTQEEVVWLGCAIFSKKLRLRRGKTGAHLRVGGVEGLRRPWARGTRLRLRAANSAK